MEPATFRVSADPLLPPEPHAAPTEKRQSIKSDISCIHPSVVFHLVFKCSAAAVGSSSTLVSGGRLGVGERTHQEVLYHGMSWTGPRSLCTVTI